MHSMHIKVILKAYQRLFSITFELDYNIFDNPLRFKAFFGISYIQNLQFLISQKYPQFQRPWNSFSCKFA